MWEDLTPDFVADKTAWGTLQLHREVEGRLPRSIREGVEGKVRRQYGTIHKRRNEEVVSD